jgi:hypothetical protein
MPEPSNRAGWVLPRPFFFVFIFFTIKKPSNRNTGQSKEIAAERLTFEKRKVILKGYWKFENVREVQRHWRREFVTDPPT